MGDIGKILADANIPSWLKILVVSLIIVTAIVGIIGTICTAYNKITKTRSKKDTPNEGEQKLETKYTSLFAEDNKLKTEQIEIKSQKNGVVEGVVTLSERSLIDEKETTYSYLLKGKYTNKVLTAEYYSKSEKVDERGAINLKLIDRKILSGFCSFSKLSANADDEIRVSPYVWVAGENKNLINGSFDFCETCFLEHKVCCCASDKVDMPIFLGNETALIRNQLSNKAQEKNVFSKNLSDPFQKSQVRQIKREEKKDSNGNVEYSKCVFFNFEEQKCKIYNGRPIDCRLFPYDIKLSENKKEYVIGYYTSLCNRNLPDEAIMKKNAHILRPYFFLLYPYLHITTSEQVCEKLKNAEFQELYDFKDFVF